MNFIARIVAEVQAWWNEEAVRPLTVSIMGQTGVGKSSLINTLFNTDLNTDPVRPGTTDIQKRHVEGKSGHDIFFYDLPGIGESQKNDEEYLKQYKQKLFESDITIWAILADSRSFTFDRDALNKLLDSINDEQRVQLMSKIIFILTKVDLLTPTTPSPWILYKVKNDEGIFAPTESIKELIKQKELYFEDAFISPFRNLIRGQTYSSGKINIKVPNLVYERSNSNKHSVYYNGFLEPAERDRLKALFPRYTAMFDRLYDSYRVIPCSSRFRYNLDHLMRVITDRLEAQAIGRFGGFLTSGTMNKVRLSDAKRYHNIVLVDKNRGFKLDLNDVDF